MDAKIISNLEQLAERTEGVHIRLMRVLGQLPRDRYPYDAIASIASELEDISDFAKVARRELKEDK